MVHAITSEFLVNDKTEFAQHNSAITPFVGGGFAIGWVDVQSEQQTTPFGEVILPVSDQIRGRAFDPTGQPVASSLVLSGEGPSDDTFFSDLDGTVLANGDVAFGWRTHWTDVYEEQTRTFSAGLVATSDVTTPEFGGTSTPRLGLDLASTTGADYLLAFLADGAGRLDAISGASRTLRDTHIQDATALSAVDLADDNAALVFYGPLEHLDNPTLNFQKLDATGTALAPRHSIPFEPGPVNTISTALLSNGNIVVVLGFTGQVQGRALVIDPDGNIVIPAFAHHDGKVAALRDGGFAIAWTDQNPATGDGSGSAIKTQVFSSDGTALGGEILVNSSTSNSQFDPSVTGLANGDFVVSWTDASGQGGDTSSTSIKARIFALDTPPSVDGVVKDGDDGNNILTGTRRDDILRGHDGKDWLFGHKGDDRLEGGEGNDKIFGGKGDDTVLGGAGHDRIWTGKGRDVILFNEGDGKDRVFDFDQRRHGDNHSFDSVQLAVSNGTNVIDDFAELEALIASGDIGLNTRKCSLTLTFDNGDALTLRGVRELSADDWLFI